MLNFDLSDILFDNSGDGLNERTVKYYEGQLQRGEQLPSPVIYRLPSGKYAVLDGRHRLEAAKRRGATSFSAYLVDVEGMDDAALCALGQKLHRLHHSPEDN